MSEAVYLEPVPDGDISIARCSLCREEFHSSPVGPRKCMSDFARHVRDRHPQATLQRPPWALFRLRTGK